MAAITVDTSLAVSAENFHTIQAAVNAASNGDVITVAAGVYNENVVISTSGISLVSAAGRDATSIVGSLAGPGLGSITITPGVDNVRIGDTGQGFKIVGFDGTNPALEYGAIYLQGAHANITIQGNELEANGELALASEYGSAINGMLIDGNIFSGATFDDTAGLPEFTTFGSSQFTIGNVPRPLVYFGNTNKTDIVFSNNEVTALAGGVDPSGDYRGQTLVVIDGAGNTATGNTFDGENSGPGNIDGAPSLRMNGAGHTITDNDFVVAKAGGFSTNSPGTATISGNEFAGTTGDDYIFATPGNQTIDAGDGSDTYDMVGAGAAGSFVDLNSGTAFSTNTGIDTLVSVENIKGSAGSDGLYGNAGDNIFIATAGADIVDGRGGVDSFNASAATTAVTANLATGAVSGAFTATLTSIENISTGSGADSITGSSDDNVIQSGGGADTVAGGGGADEIDAGAGIDTVTFAGNRDGYSVTWDGATATVTEISTGDATTVANAGLLSFGDKDVFLVSATGDFATIQSAVNAAAATASTDEVLIAAGDYAEQVIVSGSAGITLTGLGDVNIIAPPDVGPTATSSSGRALNGVFTAVNSTNVVLNNIDIDGAARAATIDGPSANYVGVVFRNTAGTLTDVDITGVRDAYPGGTTADGFPVVSGNQRGVGLQVDNDAKLAFTMTGGSITDFQKNATVFNGADLNVSGVTITGGGAQTINAQNGIQATNSSGLISGNTITAIGYAGAQVVYSGAMLLYGNTDLNVVGNTITGPNGANADAKVVGIFVLDFGVPTSGGSITGNVISFVDSGIDVSGDLSPNGIAISGNTITDLDGNDPYTGGVTFAPSPLLTTTFDISGSAEDDYLAGASGGDTLSGLAGNDVLDGMAGADSMVGGTGDDTYAVDNAGDVVTELAGEGADSVVASVSYELAAGTEVESLSAATGASPINLTGNEFGQTIAGNAGANVLDGAGGNDIIDGGDGADTAVISSAAADATVSWDIGTSSFTIVSADGTDSLKNVEKVDFDGADVWLVTTAAQLTAALAGAASGDVIKLAPGEYQGSFAVGVSGITIESVTGIAADVVLEGSFRSANGIADGVSVQAWLQTATGFAPGVNATGLTISASDVTVNNITISSYNSGISLGNSSGVTLSGIVLDGNVNGVRKGTEANVTDFTWTGGEVKDGQLGATFNAAENDAGEFAGVLISGVTFSNLNEKGLYFEQLEQAELLDLVMTNVGQFGRSLPFGGLGTFGAGIDINLKYEDYSDIEIAGFTFTNVGASNQNGAAAFHEFGGAITIKARDDGAAYGGLKQATLDGVSIHDGTIDGTSTGIRIGEPTKTNAGPENVTVEDVAISNAAVADYDNRTQSELKVTLTGGDDEVSTNPGATGPITITGLGGNDTYTINGSEQIVEAANDGVDTVEARGSHTLAANVENLTLLDAGSDTQTFQNFTTGAITDGENGWKVVAGARDQGIVDLGGNLVLKVSSDPNTPDFAGPYSPGLSVAAGEASTTADGEVHVLKFRVKPVSEVADNSRLEVDFGNEAGTDRNSFMVIESIAGQGLRIAVADAQLDGSFATGAVPNTFTAFTGNRTLVSGLDSSEWHDIELRLTYGDGQDDDVVAVYVDGVYAGETNSFENYRDALGQVHDTAAEANQTNRIFIRPTAGGAPTDGPGGQNQGFYFDNVTNTITTHSTATGNALANVITGNAGDNVIAGLGGADTIDGAGGSDTADYGAELYSAATFAYDEGSSAFTVTTAAAGADTLTNVEKASFGDRGVWLVDSEAELAFAIANAGAGDVIKVAPGDYSGNYVIDTALTLEGLGAPGDVTFTGTFRTDNAITGETVGQFLQDAPGYSGSAGSAFTVAADDVTISNITITAYRTGIQLNSSAGTTISGVDISETVHAIYKESGAAVVTDFTLTGGSITDGYQGVIINAAVGAGAFDGVVISGTVFERLTEKGIYAEQLSDAEIFDIVMTNVGEFGRGTSFGGFGTFGAGIDINLKYGTYDGIDIHDFVFTDVGSSTGAGSPHVFGGAIVIKQRDDAPSYSANPATLTDVTVSDGTITGTSTGIRIGEPGKVNGGPTGVSVDNVAISGADLGSYDNRTSTVLVVTLSGDDDTVTTNASATGAISYSGLAGADAITGGSGADQLIGGSGDDSLEGGAGADIINGGADVDTASYAGSTAGVTINLFQGTASGGHAQGDTLALIENLTGSANADSLTGDAGANLLNGGGGNDTMSGGDGADTILGGAGDADTVSYSGNWDDYTITRLFGTTYTVSDGVSTDVISGVERFDFADQDFTTDDPDEVTSGGIGGLGSPLVNSEQAATDTPLKLVAPAASPNGPYTFTVLTLPSAGTVYSGATPVALNAVLTLAQYQALTYSAPLGSAGLFGITFQITDGVDTESFSVSLGVSAGVNSALTGNNNANRLDGAFGDDVVSGLGGADELLGGIGNDRLIGGLGVDTLKGGMGNDTFVEPGGDTIVELAGQGSDTVETAGNFSLVGLSNVENITLTGSGNTSATGDAGANFLTGNSGDNRMRGNGGADTLAGGLGNDTYIDPTGATIREFAGQGTDTIEASRTFSLSGISHVENLTLTGTGNFNAIGNTAANVITGNDGSNRFRGAGGADTLIGGLGNDVYIDPQGATIVELAGGGTDTVESTLSFNLTSVSNVENLTLTGLANIDATGDAFANFITGNGGNNRLVGGGGADTLAGGEGNDTYVNPTGLAIVENVNGGSDTVESSATFSISGAFQVENLTLTGSANVNATGNSYDNVLTGNSGNNRLRGQQGSDTLDGGAGSDTFVYGNVVDSTGASRDHVLSMNLNQDKFDFSVVPSSLAAAVTSGALSEASFDVDLAAAIGAAQMGIGQAVLFTANTGDLAIAGQSFLIVDANGIAGYQAGQDYVVQLSNATGTLSLDDFT